MSQKCQNCDCDIPLLSLVALYQIHSVCIFLENFVKTQVTFLCKQALKKKKKPTLLGLLCSDDCWLCRNWGLLFAMSSHVPVLCNTAARKPMTYGEIQQTTRMKRKRATGSKIKNKHWHFNSSHKKIMCFVPVQSFPGPCHLPGCNLWNRCSYCKWTWYLPAGKL